LGQGKGAGGEKSREGRRRKGGREGGGGWDKEEEWEGGEKEGNMKVKSVGLIPRAPCIREEVWDYSQCLGARMLAVTHVH